MIQPYKKDSKRAEKIAAYLIEAAFDNYFDRFILIKAHTKEPTDYGIVKKVRQQKFSVRKTEFEIM